MSRPIVALLSDFGTHDHYAGTMKGVVLGVCPDATLVDISHDIPPQDVLSGALALGACYRDFPAGTVFLVVVDPGVGSSRRAIAVEAAGYRFVAPDNGVLTMVLRDETAARVVELTARHYARAAVSRTFEGRDRFAPAAGWLATGLAVTALGPAVADPHHLEIAVPSLSGDRVVGEVLRVDHFGNLITNIDRGIIAQCAPDRGVAVSIAGHAIGAIVDTYAEVPAGALCALFGSSEHLEIAVNAGNAAASLGLGRGAPVTVRRS